MNCSIYYKSVSATCWEKKEKETFKMCSDSAKNAHGLLARNDHVFCSSSTFMSPLQHLIHKL